MLPGAQQIDHLIRLHLVVRDLRPHRRLDLAGPRPRAHQHRAHPRRARLVQGQPRVAPRHHVVGALVRPLRHHLRLRLPIEHEAALQAPRPRRHRVRKLEVALDLRHVLLPLRAPRRIRAQVPQVVGHELLRLPAAAALLARARRQLAARARPLAGARARARARSSPPARLLPRRRHRPARLHRPRARLLHARARARARAGIAARPLAGPRRRAAGPVAQQLKKRIGPTASAAGHQHHAQRDPTPPHASRLSLRAEVFSVR